MAIFKRPRCAWCGRRRGQVLIYRDGPYHRRCLIGDS